MQKNYKKFLQGAVAFPMMAMHLATTPVTGAVASLPSAAAIFPEQIGTVSVEETVNPQLLVEAAKIDAYLAKRNSPLVGQGLHLAETAKENGFDYRVIAAIVTIESNAGLMACSKDKENIGGYMSCKGINFDSYEEAIDVIGKTLGGNMPKSSYHYVGKTLNERLVKYNGNANPAYVRKIHLVMNQIDQMQVPEESTVAVATVVKA